MFSFALLAKFLCTAIPKTHPSLSVGIPRSHLCLSSMASTARETAGFGARTAYSMLHAEANAAACAFASSLVLCLALRHIAQRLSSRKPLSHLLPRRDLPRHVAKVTDNDQRPNDGRCSICLEAATLRLKLQCGHRFGRPCVPTIGAPKRNDHCHPFCRAEVFEPDNL